MCLTCVRVTGPVIVKIPCLRYKIPDARFLDQHKQPYQKWTTRWKSMEIKEIKSWASPDIRTIFLSQDVGSAENIVLKVREHIPVRGDALRRSWLPNGPGVRQYHDVAPYAVENMKATSVEIREQVDRNIPAFISHYIGNTDDLLRSTYDAAYKHSKNSKVGYYLSSSFDLGLTGVF
jgi:hypothetical protein